MRLNSNTLSMMANRFHRKNNRKRVNSAAKLSSGFRINRASDDAAGLGISQKMQSQIRGLQMNQRNIQGGMSLLDTADGALQSMQEGTQRLRELSIQSANDTLVESDREDIKEEMKEISHELGRTAKQTQFNTMPLLDGTFSKKTEEVRADNSEPLSVNADWVSKEVELGGFDLQFSFKLSRDEDENNNDNDELEVRVRSEGKLIASGTMKNNPIEWEATAGGSKIDIGSDIIKTEDGGFISVGTTSSQDEDSLSNTIENDNIFAVKFNHLGDVKWANTYENQNNAEGASISRLDNDEGYLISATSGSSAGDSDIMLLKIDEKGKKTFKQTYGGQNDFGRSIHNIAGGGKILAGNVNARHGNDDILLLKFDEAGKVKWEKQIENKYNDDSVYDIKSIFDDEGNLDGFLVAGQSGNRGVLHKIDTDGNLIDTVKPHGGTIREVQELEDGNIITVGHNNAGTRIEIRKFNKDLEYLGSESINTGSVDQGVGVEIIDNNGSEEIVISATTTANDGSQEASTIRLDTNPERIWQTFDDLGSKKDFGSHGNKGDQIYSKTGGGYLAAGLDNRIAQFNEEGIFEWELDFAKIEDGDYANYNIENIVTGEEGYFITLHNESEDSLRMAKVNYNKTYNINELSQISGQDFQKIHLLADGEDGFVVETIENDQTEFHKYDNNLNHLQLENPDEEFKVINGIISTSNGITLIGESKWGDVNINLDLDDEIYDGLTINFTDNASADNETVVYNHEENELTVDLHSGTNYTIEEIDGIVNDTFESEDVITYYNAGDLNNLVDAINDDYDDEASLDYLNFFVDGDDLSSFDLDDLNLELTGENGETAIAEIDINGTTLKVEGNTAFRESESITISDKNDINETITFDTLGDDWSVDPNDNDEAMSQAERIKDIIDSHLDGHTAHIIGDGNQLRITEGVGEANGQDIDINTTEGYLDFSTLEESVKEVQGEYSFQLAGNVVNDETIEIDGVILTAGDDFALGDEDETANNIIEAINDNNNLNDRFTASAGAEVGEIILTENEGEATGINLTEIGGNANTQGFSVDINSEEEVQGEYELTIGNNEVFYGKEINLGVVENLNPGGESAELDGDLLNVNLAQDIKLEEFSITSDVAFESSGDKWANGEELVLSTENGSASASELYLNSLSNLWVAELDNDGDLEDQEVYGGSGVDQGATVIERDGGGYVIVAQTSSQDGDLDGVAANDDNKTWIKVLDENLDIEWQEVDSDLIELTDIRAVDDNNFLLFGKNENNNPVIYNLSNNGEWETTKSTSSLQLTSELSISEVGSEYQISGTDEDGSLHIINTADFADEKSLANYSSEAAAIATLEDGSTILATNKELLSGRNNGVVRKIDEEGELVWEREVHTSHQSVIEDIQQTSDGKLILTGMLDGEMVIYELNADDGSLNWSQSYNGLSSLSIDESDDGNYMITGHRQMENQGELYQSPSFDFVRDMTVLKVDKDNGSLIWQKDYGADNETTGNALPTMDGGYIVTGTVTSYTNSKYDDNTQTGGNYDGTKNAVVMKVDQNGSWEWDIELSAEDNNLDVEGAYIQEVNDGYMMVANKENEDGNSNLWVAKIERDDDGKYGIGWNQIYSSESNTTVTNISTTKDGGFIMTGSKDDDLWIAKLEENSNEGYEINEESFGGGGIDIGYHVQQTSDGGYIVTGSSASNNLPDDNLEGRLKGQEDTLIVKFSDNLDYQWGDLIGGGGSDRGKSIREVEKGRYILTGSTTSSDGDISNQLSADGSDSSMWTVQYARDLQQKSFSSDEEVAKEATIGTGEIFLESTLSTITFDWDKSEVTKIEAQGAQRTDAKFGVQVGPNSDQKSLTRIDNVSREELGFAEGWLDGDFSEEDFVAQTLNVIDGAIDKLSSTRSQIGAFTNRLSHALSNTENYYENLSDSHSRINDVDMAKEIVEDAKAQILSQTITSIMAQANSKPETVLQLLQV